MAAVSIVYADVTFGCPTRERLDTPEVRPVVAEATRAALAALAARGDAT